jgi:hypothetical protein
LQPLADNGGPTHTHALSAGSPAIDAGDNPFGLINDQRGAGFPRTTGAAADIGAFEGFGAQVRAPVNVPLASRGVLALFGVALALLGSAALRRTGRSSHSFTRLSPTRPYSSHR